MTAIVGSAVFGGPCYGASDDCIMRGYVPVPAGLQKIAGKRCIGTSLSADHIRFGLHAGHL